MDDGGFRKHFDRLQLYIHCILLIMGATVSYGLIGASIGALCGASDAETLAIYPGHIVDGTIGEDAATLVEGRPIDLSEIKSEAALNGAMKGSIVGAVYGVPLDIALRLRQ